MNIDASPAITSLYQVPGLAGTRLRAVLVAPARVPGWLRAFRDLAERTGWVDLAVVSGFEAPLDIAEDVGIGIRMFLALERVLHGGFNASLEPEVIAREHPSHSQEGALERLRERVESLSPDIVLLVGPSKWATTFAPLARHGCWHLDASLTDARHAGLSLVDSMLRSEPSTPVGLVLRQVNGTDSVVAESSCRTRQYSFLMTRADAFAKLPQLLLRSLHRIASGNESLPERVPSTLRLQSRGAAARGEGVRLMLSTVLAKGRWLGRRFAYDGWSLVLRTDPDPLDPAAPTIGSHAFLEAAKGWWADPCVVAVAGRTLVFVEEMDLATNKGEIACVELVDGGARRLGTVLRESGHLSFPQVFELQGRWYMTVESGYARRASLYQARHFPLDWVRVRDLVTGWHCADPVLHQQDGHWYLFVTVAESGKGTSDDLFLFVADSLDGAFRAHPSSPVVCDVRRARMAGALFRHQGRLIRPSQDGGPGYGSAVIFSEVLELTPHVYRERLLSRFSPDWAPTLRACHTYSAGGLCEILDVGGRPPPGSRRLRLLDSAPVGSS